MKNIAYILIIIIASIVSLIYARSILIPLVIAFLFWFFNRTIITALDRIPFFKNKINNRLKHILVSTLMITIILFISKMLATNINNLAASYLNHQSNFDMIILKLDKIFNLDVVLFIEDSIGKINISSILTLLINSVTNLFSDFFMMIIYVLFIFIEEINFDAKLRTIFNSENSYNNVTSTLNKIETSISNYLGLKTLTSLLTGIISYIILFFIEIDAPLFWAFLIFMLNYIPTIGSLLATSLPAIYSLFQFGDFNEFLFIMALVGSTQVLVGNIIEPKIMGNSLNISPLVSILALSFWGAIWGVTGMFLSVPVTVIMIILLAQIPSTRNFAVLLSERGRV